MSREHVDWLKKLEHQLDTERAWWQSEIERMEKLGLRLEQERDECRTTRDLGWEAAAEARKTSERDRQLADVAGAMIKARDEDVNRLCEALRDIITLALSTEHVATRVARMMNRAAEALDRAAEALDSPIDPGLIAGPAEPGDMP